MSALDVNFNAEAAGSMLNLDRTNIALSEAIQELSSGLAVQDAEQGPAAWSISNYLQYQNSGDEQSLSNTQQGVSVLNIASGAINQIAGILDQMEQLATSSANSGAMTTTQMAANNVQFQALSGEINKIVANTKYGTKALLDGTYGQSGQATTPEPPTTYASFPGIIVSPGFNTFDVNADGSTESLTVPNGTYTAAQFLTALNNAGQALAIPVTVSVDGSGYVVFSAPGSVQILPSSNLYSLANDGWFPKLQGSAPGTPEQFQVGFQSTDTLQVAVPSVASSALGISSASISTQSGASEAIAAVQSALGTLTSVSATVGATQDQLQALHQDLQSMSTNVQAANSSVVDVNMAQEMTTFTTQQILMQSGLSMLGQAQANPTLVLKLL